MKGILLLALTLATTTGWASMVTPTVGKVWPMPQMEKTESTFMVIRPSTFKFSVIGHNCEILQEAIKRYTTIIFDKKQGHTEESMPAKPWRKDENFRDYLDEIKINLMGKCQDLPTPDMDEHYEIKIDSPDAPGEASLMSWSIWGILRGLETFSQLLQPSSSAYKINSTQIMDFPRFAFRGIMIDTARHFLPVELILETLDLMAMNKFNVLHWHIVDDQSFPYVSAAFPNLSRLGAFSPLHTYTSEDMAQVVEYARFRGIRVLPEFDTPGHTQSWGPGQPGFLTPCYQNCTLDGTFGPVDPINENNYVFLKEFLTEVTSRFPDKYIHLGGDEVSFTCWKSNPNITEYMETHNITGDYSKLEQVYITRLLDIVSKLPTQNGYLVWQEVFDNGVEIAPDTVVHIWKGEDTPVLYEAELKKVTEAGFKTVLSSCWYLNYISYGVDWHKYYNCDPQHFNGTDAQKNLVMGGEACMWGEYVDRTNLTPRLWPRASVVAERLWSNAEDTSSTDEATPRLEEHRCRLLKRGYDVEPLWPSFCEGII